MTMDEINVIKPIIGFLIKYLLNLDMVWKSQ